MSQSSLNAADLDRFGALIHDQSGLDFPMERRADLERVIGQALAETGVRDVAALWDLITGGASEPILQRMIAELTVGETYFFRNEPQFRALEHHILPELIARRRPSRHLRLWSAGCASGEEPYSLAILLERLLPDLAEWHIHILATDINPQMLARAREGRYGEWSFRQTPAVIRDRYFAADGVDRSVHPRLRERVTFARLNLVDDSYPSILTHTRELDLILCRNVLIYFREETVRRIARRFYDALADGGWLIVGHAEPSQSVFGQFAVHNLPGTVVYRKESVPSPQAGHQPADPARPAAWMQREPVAALARAQPVSPRLDPAHSERSPLDEARRCANRMDWDQAERRVVQALAQTPLSAPAHYLHGLILLEKGEPDAALAALRRCVFVEPEFVLGHLALANLFTRQGQPARSRKALETVGRLAAARPAQEMVPEGDGLTAGRLLELVRTQQQ